MVNQPETENKQVAPPEESVSLFSSPRERRLWMCTIAIVIAIYLTLGVASSFAGILYNQGLSAIVFLYFMLMVGVTVLLFALRVRPGGAEIGVAVGIATVYLFALFRMSIPERSHIIEYSVVAAFIYAALLERRSQGRRVAAPSILAILATTLIGTVDELIQLVLPSRVFDTNDILFNFLAAVMAVGGFAALRWARMRFTSQTIPENLETGPEK